MIRGIQGRLRAIPLLIVLGLLVLGASSSPAPVMANAIPNTGNPTDPRADVQRDEPDASRADWEECGVVVAEDGSMVRQSLGDSRSGAACAVAAFKAPECGPPGPFRGCYVVIFSRNVRDCTYLATIGIPGDVGVVSQPSFIDTSGRVNDVNGVFVYTRDSLTSPGSDRPFHLLVHCTPDPTPER